MYSQQEWIKYSLYGIGYALAFHILWYVSTSLEMVQYSVSWYLPAGLRIAVYLFTPFRSWPFLYVFFSISHIILFQDAGLLANPALDTQSWLWYVSNFLISPAALMFLVWKFRKSNCSSVFAEVESSVYLLLLFLTVSIVNAACFVGLMAIGSTEYEVTLLDNMFHFVLGDMVGIFVIYPLWITGRELLTNANKETFYSILTTCFNWIAILIGYAFITGYAENVDYYVKVLGILPAIYFSYRYGWRGAITSVFFLCVMTYLSSLMNQGTALENQFYILSASLCCMFLGASVSEQRELSRSIKLINAELMHSNRQLKSQINTNHMLSSRLINMQENERKRLSRELHDDFGQRITEIKINISLAMKCKAEITNDYLKSVLVKADELYRSLKQSIGNLRPAGLDEFGLVNTLRIGDLAKLVNAKGINYNVEVVGKEPQLTDEQAIGLYRICQESVNNSIKHANPTQIDIQVSTSQSMLALQISDNGRGFDVDSQTGGFGFASMKERTLALGGEHTVVSDKDGTIVTLLIYI